MTTKIFIMFRKLTFKQKNAQSPIQSWSNWNRLQSWSVFISGSQFQALVICSVSHKKQLDA